MADFKYQGRIYYTPIELTMTFIGGTWKIPIILSLRKGALRYGDFKKMIPHITDKMLFSQLRALEKTEMVIRKSYREKPPRVEYKLTAFGKRSLLVIDSLHRFGEYLMSHESVEIVRQPGK
jgi:DNA-binding HxlR family transcriptional regulator